MKIFLLAATACVAIATSATAATIYGNSAGSNALHTLDGTTGVESARFLGGKGNGRGIVVVGNVIYYTVVGDSKIYTMDRTSGLNTGFIQTSNASMATLAWDGSQFWTADYSGSNKAFRINLAGANTSTITLANATGNMDGLEWFNGKLIGNRCDACGIYDIYDLSGNVLTAGFITSAGSSTGIAYDGANFVVSNVFGSSVSYFSGTTGTFLNTVNLTGGGGGFLIEDLSVDYSVRPDTGGAVPEPATWAMMIAGFGIAGMSLRSRRRNAVASLA